MKSLTQATAACTGAPKGSRVRGVTWVKPVLVAEVEFTELTSEGLMRHPAFCGLRDDKPASEVVRERKQPKG